MKKRFAVMFAVLLCVVLLSGVFSPVKAPAATLVAVASDDGDAGARFLNMLNHNFVYDEGFNTFEDLTEGAVIANLSLRDGNYIAEAYVKGYLFDMYGINAVDFGQGENENHRDGYLYIKPTGFTRYTHENPTVTNNEDGTFTVITDVVVSPHDDIPYETVAVSLFAPNDESSFGYTLVYSNIDPVSAEY